MKKYYIASRLENVDQVRAVKAELDARGWQHTYDWTVHGSVQKCDETIIMEVARKEIQGVISADVVIVLLKGGRGTHAELGAAIVNTAYHPSNRIAIFSPDPEKDFGTSGETCAFYHHQYVEKFTNLADMIDELARES